MQLVSFTNDWNTVLSTPFVRTIGKEIAGLKKVQIGDEILLPTDYEDNYITKEVGVGSGNFLVYAKRFIGTKYESAWRYEYKTGDATNGGSRLIIKNVMLWKNSGKSLVNDIAKETFFDINNSTERIFPASGFIWMKYNQGGSPASSTTVSLLGGYGYYWTSTLSSWNDACGWNVFHSFINLSDFPTSRGYTLRPFKKH